MTEQIKDGGRAFPFIYPDEVTIENGKVISLHLAGDDGMSLRVWLAGMAMQGMLRNAEPGWSPTAISSQSFIVADAMIKQMEAK